MSILDNEICPFVATRHKCRVPFNVTHYYQPAHRTSIYHLTQQIVFNFALLKQTTRTSISRLSAAAVRMRVRSRDKTVSVIAQYGIHK